MTPWERHAENAKSPLMRVRLTFFRKRLGLTLKQMAERAGYSVSQISRWEAHVSSIPSKNLPALALAYSCRVSEVFAEDWERPEGGFLSESALREMVATALLEVPGGTPLSGFPPIVASSLRDQIAQARASGGFRDSQDDSPEPDPVAPPPGSTNPAARARSRKP